MAIGILGASLIGAGISAAGSVASSLTGKASNKDSNKANMELAQYQNEANLQYQQNEFAHNKEESELAYQRALEQWNMENEYNTPTSQVARLKEAGLNPNLAYGTGATASTAAASPQYAPAKYNAPTAQRAQAIPEGKVDFGQAIQVASQVALQRANVDNLNAQVDLTRQEVQNRQIDNLLKVEQLTSAKTSNKYADAQQFWKTLDIKHSQINRTKQGNLMDLQADKIRYELDHITPQQSQKLSSEILNLRLTNDIKAFELELNKIGINTRDPFWARLGARLVNASDDNFSSFLRQLLTK